MSHIKNFKDWFRVYESAGFKYRPGMAIFEDEGAGPQINPNMPEPLQPGAAAEGLSIKVTGGDTPIAGASFKKVTHYNDLISKAGKIPGLRFRKGSQAQSFSNSGVGFIVINNALYGIYWKSGLSANKKLRKSLGIAGGKTGDQFASFREKYGFSREAEKLGLKISDGTEVPVNFRTEEKVSVKNGQKYTEIKVYTLGSISGNSPSIAVKNIDKESTVYLANFIAYVNAYNLQNFTGGHNEQYDITMNSDGFVDLSVTSQVTNKLLLYAEGTPGKTSISREETEEGSEGSTETTGAQPGGTGSAAIGYANMKYNVDTNGKAIDANNPEVQRCAAEIVAALGEATDVKLDSIEITSSASTSWNGATMPASNGTGDPSEGKLTETTFAADKTALGNQYLAWLRGKTFADALKSALGELAFDTQSINWKVSNEGIAGGKNISFSWNKISNPGTTYTKPGNLTTKVKSAESKTAGKGGKDSGAIYKYEMTWNNSLFGATPTEPAAPEEGE